MEQENKIDSLNKLAEDVVVEYLIATNSSREEGLKKTKEIEFLHLLKDGDKVDLTNFSEGDQGVLNMLLSDISIFNAMSSVLMRKFIDENNILRHDYAEFINTSSDNDIKKFCNQTISQTSFMTQVMQELNIEE